MPSLNWQPAKNEHRSCLQTFECADPPKAKWMRDQRRQFHPRPWQLEVQKAFRAAKPLTGPDEFFLLGFHPTDDKLGAGCRVCLIQEDDRFFKILFVGRACCYRGKRYGAEALLVATLRMIVTMEQVEPTRNRILAIIDKNNQASQRLFSEFGFARAPVQENVGPNEELWGARVDRVSMPRDVWTRFSETHLSKYR